MNRDGELGDELRTLSREVVELYPALVDLRRLPALDGREDTAIVFAPHRRGAVEIRVGYSMRSYWIDLAGEATVESSDYVDDAGAHDWALAEIVALAENGLVKLSSRGWFGIRYRSEYHVPNSSGDLPPGRGRWGARVAARWLPW